MQDERIKEFKRLTRITSDRRSPARTPRAAVKRFLRYGDLAFRRLFKVETGVALTGSASDGDLARSVFFHSPEQRHRREGGSDWYRANAELFRRYAPVACSLMPADIEPPDVPHYLMLGDAMHLLKQHNRRLRHGDFDYGPAETGLLPFAQLFHRSRRVLSSRSTDVNIGAMTIGLAIESRLKSAFGTYDVCDPRNDRLARHVSVFQIFRAMKLHGSRIRLAVDLDVLVMIYNWSSNHRRAGPRSYSWLNYFANDLIAPLFTPKALQSPGTSCDYGIETDRQTLLDIREAIREATDPANPNAVISGPAPDDCALALVPSPVVHTLRPKRANRRDVPAADGEPVQAADMPEATERRLRVVASKA